MSIQFPAELGWLFPSVVGDNWPSAHEDLLRECADAWRRAGNEVREGEETAWQLTRRVAGTMEGEAADASMVAIDGFVTGDEQSLRELSTACDRLAGACEAYATAVEQTKLAIIDQLVPIGKAIQTALSLTAHTGAASLAGVADQLELARTQVRTTVQDLVGRAEEASSALRNVAVFEDVRVAAEGMSHAAGEGGEGQRLLISEGDPLHGLAAVPHVPGVGPSPEHGQRPLLTPGQAPLGEVAGEGRPNLAEFLSDGKLTEEEIRRLNDAGAALGEDADGPAEAADEAEELADAAAAPEAPGRPGSTSTAGAAPAPPPPPPPPPPPGAVTSALEGGGGHSGSAVHPGGARGGGGPTVTAPGPASSPPVSRPPAGGWTRPAGGTTSPAGVGGSPAPSGGGGSGSGAPPVRPGPSAPGGSGLPTGGGSGGGAVGGGSAGTAGPGGPGPGARLPGGGAVPPAGSAGSVVLTPGPSTGGPGQGVGGGARTGDATDAYYRGTDAPGRPVADQPVSRGRDVGYGQSPPGRTLPAPDTSAPMPGDPAARPRGFGRGSPLFLLVTGAVHRPEYSRERRRERPGPPPMPEHRFREEFTREDFHQAARKPVEDLGEQELASLAWLHRAVALEETTTMQKILTPWQVDRCLAGSGHGVGGFVVRWDDVAASRGPAELQESFGLGYREPDGKRPFDLADPDIHLVRFPAMDPAAYKRPFGGRHPDHAALYRERWRLASVDDVEVWSYPFTGTGFTGSQQRVVPIFVVKEDLPTPNGAEMYRLTADGDEDLLAVYVVGRGWVKVVDDGPAMEAR